ncbi:hypothetical protein V6N12_069137 [Hibiscus sabdariffa]|uniref:Uncharacterized protein n=1 Tax=Hibiscus sabdariffa TaxID=183260 RepID=A0ABR2FCY5_9ROSI
MSNGSSSGYLKGSETCPLISFSSRALTGLVDVLLKLDSDVPHSDSLTRITNEFSALYLEAGAISWTEPLSSGFPL